MSQMNIIQAVNSAMHVMFERDDTVVSFGEDAGYYGGVFRCTAGLQEKFGKHRSLCWTGFLYAGDIASLAIRPAGGIRFSTRDGLGRSARQGVRR